MEHHCLLVLPRQQQIQAAVTWTLGSRESLGGDGRNRRTRDRRLPDESGECSRGKSSCAARVRRWCLVVHEYGVMILYVPVVSQRRPRAGVSEAGQAPSQVQLVDVRREDDLGF